MCMKQHGDCRVLLDKGMTVTVQESMFLLGRFQTKNL